MAAPRAATERGRGRLLLRAREHIADARIEVWQGDRRLDAQRLAHVMAGRSVALAAGWMAAVDPSGPTVSVRVVSARVRGWGGRSSRGSAHDLAADRGFS